MKSDLFTAPVYGSVNPEYGFCALIPGHEVLAGSEVWENPYGPNKGLN